jgi:hypothetical protein
MRIRVIAAAAVCVAAGVFGQTSASANDCYGVVNYCSGAGYCSGDVNYCEHADQCSGYVNYCKGTLTILH